MINRGDIFWIEPDDSRAAEASYAHPHVVVQAIESASDLGQALEIRARVFVEEQGVPAELERDVHDAGCTHLLATLGARPVGTARYRHTPEGCKVERVAVLRDHRGRGIGSALVHYLCGAVSNEALYVHAQVSAVSFWERLGFSIEGVPFDEAGIVHRVMRLRAP